MSILMQLHCDLELQRVCITLHLEKKENFKSGLFIFHCNNIFY